MINKKAVALATVIIIALFAGFTIGYAVKSKTQRNQIYEKYIVNSETKNTNDNTVEDPAPAVIEEE